jgi:hypothetical protein
MQNVMYVLMMDDSSGPVVMSAIILLSLIAVMVVRVWHREIDSSFTAPTKPRKIDASHWGSYGDRR